MHQTLNFTLITGDEDHNRAIAAGLSTIPLKTFFKRFQDCESLMGHLNSHQTNEYYVVMLDMETPVNVGMECLRAIRKEAIYNEIVVIAYKRIDDEEAVKEIFIEGANIFFTYPKNTSDFNVILKKLVAVNRKILTSVANRNYMMLKL